LALARFFLDRPDVVAGRRILDLGAGSGLVGIAAARAGARQVVAAEIDTHAIAALELNAAANGVEIAVLQGRPMAAVPPAVDLVAVGDLFYERDLAQEVIDFLDRCVDQRIEVLVGDPGRKHLPLTRLRRRATYAVPDFGAMERASSGLSGVYAYRPVANIGLRPHSQV
jgi:predicted nicotinamide N-methyase